MYLTEELIGVPKNRRKPRMGRKTEGIYGRIRRPKTTQERRLSFHNKDEGEPKIRPKRRCHSLPSAWDDIVAHNDASWKTQSKRKHQYKRKI